MSSRTARDQEALRLAFSTPFHRARSAAGIAERPLDRIVLEEHIRSVEIGAFQEERGHPQRVRFDIVAEVAPDPEAVRTDDVDGILSYDTLIDAIDVELAAGRVNILEALAERLASRVLLHDRVARVFVRIGKLDRGPHVLGVEIVRSRDATLLPASPSRAPRPRIVLLPPGAQDAPDLSERLDGFMAGAEPVVLVAQPDFPVPQTGNCMAQRRIDLLAIEQAAWRLAARDRRCIVVDSRTELEWLLIHRSLSVWAPARLVLDAADGPDSTDPAALARWLGRRLDARSVDLP
jgi:dihydroneopterin aldolase